MLHAAQCVSLVTESCTAGSCRCWRGVLDEAGFASKGKLGSEGRKQSRGRLGTEVVGTTKAQKETFGVAEYLKS